MDFLLAIAWPLLLSTGLLLAFGGLVFLFRKHMIKSEGEMISFLDRRFEFIRQGGFWRRESDFIDQTLIRRWGQNAWAFLGITTILLSHASGEIADVGFWLALTVLFFGGLILGDSWAAAHFLRALGLPRFQKERDPKK